MPDPVKKTPRKLKHPRKDAPKPSKLGTGGAANTGQRVINRMQDIDAAIKKAGG